MDKYVIFSDVDGTIYGKNFKIHSQLKKDIDFARSKGVDFVVSTGNGAIFKNMKLLSKNLDIRYLITSNGASIFDAYEKKYLFENKINIQYANILLKKAEELKLSANWWDDIKMYYNDYTQFETINFLQKIMGDIKLKKTNHATHEPYKIEFYHDGYETQLNTMQIFAKKLGMQVVKMSNGHLEITKKNVSKGSAIQIFCDMFKININHTMGIGDSPNDFSMFAIVGRSYAMDNAKKDVKEKTDHYTSDVLQNGLGEAIIDYLYREKIDKKKS